MDRVNPEDIVYPFVHMNGTSRQNLIERRVMVYDAIAECDRMLSLMAPNGRDYSPVPGSMDKAVEQHQRRSAMLRMIQDEVQAEIDYLETTA